MTDLGVTMESADAGWMVDVRQVFGRAARLDETEEVDLEMMSLGELMYYALVAEA